MYIFYDSNKHQAHIRRWNSEPIKEEYMTLAKALEMALKWGIPLQYDNDVEDWEFEETKKMLEEHEIFYLKDKYAVEKAIRLFSAYNRGRWNGLWI